MASKPSGGEELLDELFAMFKAVPWWIGPITVASVFAAFKWAIPWLMLLIDGGADTPIKLGEMVGTISKFIAPIAALLVTVVWLAALVAKRLDAHRLDKQRNIDTIRQLSWREFEQLLAEAYRRQGYRVTDTGQNQGHAQPDGGIDLILKRDGQTTLVQCKQWKAQKVGVKIARELYGVVASQHADRGVLVTSGRFTQQAQDFAQNLPLNLIDGPQLQTLIRSVQSAAAPQTKAADAIGGVPRPPSPPLTPSKSPAHSKQPAKFIPQSKIPICPQCQSPMTRRIARKGPTPGQPFWGCTTYPRCKGTRGIQAG